MYLYCNTNLPWEEVLDKLGTNSSEWDWYAGRETVYNLTKYLKREKTYKLLFINYVILFGAFSDPLQPPLSSYVIFWIPPPPPPLSVGIIHEQSSQFKYSFGKRHMDGTCLSSSNIIIEKINHLHVFFYIRYISNIICCKKISCEMTIYFLFISNLNSFT